ncbi:MAG TPA: hypothetical protein VG734_17725 [Lacunisphaera sp.]|nr:hypothetical protein [Lacunisphaera sp.]
MNLDPAPRLNKIHFFLAAAVFFAVFLYLGLVFPNRFNTVPLIAAVTCLLLSITAIMIPLLRDFVADLEDQTQAERRRVTEQVQRLQAATESLGRAGAQIKAVEESVHKTAHAAENLPYRMQEKLAEFNESLASKDNEEREALERELDELRAANADGLKAVADKIAKSTGEWSALESSSRKQLAAVQEAAARLNTELLATLAQLEARVTALQKTAASIPTTVTIATAAPAAPATVPEGGSAPATAPATIATGEEKPAVQPAAAKVASTEAAIEPAAKLESPAKESAGAPADGIIESVTLSENATPPPPPVATVAEPKPKKARAPRKPKPEETLAAMSATDAMASTAAAPTPVAAREESAVPSALDQTVESPVKADLATDDYTKAETSVSSDGATRLLVTAYIGIGNKLFIRGDGPGLSWDKGVPMQFVSIGKWGWSSNDVTAPIACKLYKNDETAALSGEVFLEPGKHVELSALF